MKLGIHSVLSTNQLQENPGNSKSEACGTQGRIIQNPRPFPCPPNLCRTRRNGQQGYCAISGGATQDREGSLYQKGRDAAQDAFAVVITKEKGYSLPFDKRKESCMTSTKRTKKRTGGKRMMWGRIVLTE